MSLYLSGDTSRRGAVDMACAQSLPADASDAQRVQFEKGNALLRKIAARLDNGAPYRRADWADRECLCGRLLVLLARNPAAALEKLDNRQRRALAAALGARGSVGRQAAEAERVEQSAQERAQQGQPEARAWQAVLGAGALATLASGGLGLAGALLLGASASFATALAARWGRPQLRRVANFFYEQRYIYLMRRALEPFTRTALGGVDTYALRNNYARAAGVDAFTINEYLKRSGDGSVTLNQHLTRAVLQRVDAARGVSVNEAVAQVLADFTFGSGDVLLLPTLNTAFVPTRGTAHVGYRNAKDAGEFERLRQLFATNYFVPSQPLAEVPPNVLEFWAQALAYALDPQVRNHVDDDALYTMYYFVYRYIDRNDVILQKMPCPTAQRRTAMLRQSASLDRVSKAQTTIECAFEFYNDQLRKTLGMREAFWQTVQRFSPFSKPIDVPAVSTS